MYKFFSLFLCLWFISCLAEINWATFYFAEGESELVCGFNVEHGGGGGCIYLFWG
jgi:NADH:ubiquinone oxidoreductase subunit H